MVRNRKSGNNFVAKLQKILKLHKSIFAASEILASFSGGIKVKRLKKISYIQTAEALTHCLIRPGFMVLLF